MEKLYTDLLQTLVNEIYAKNKDAVEDLYKKISKEVRPRDLESTLYSLNALVFSSFQNNQIYYAEEVFSKNIDLIKDKAYGPSIFLDYIQVVEDKESSKNIYITKAFDYIEAHIDEDLSLESLASELHISKNYFSNLFKKVTGMRYCNYVNFRRIEYSKKLLTTTEYPLDVIAQKCGYNSQSHFSTTFLKFVKTSPGAYRFAYKLKQRELVEGSLFD